MSCRLVTLILSGLLLAGPAAAEPAKHLFAAKRQPADIPAASYGGYAKGCLAGGQELPETGPGWQAMRLSRNRNWGHPSAIAFVQRLSAQVQQIGWPRLYIGDISQPRGGPMRSGHRSHQLGLDSAIWRRRPAERLLGRQERETISSHVVVDGAGLGVNRYWTPKHHRVLKTAASDPGVARIFVHAAIKQEMCWTEPAGGDRAWLRKIRPWYGHNAHFHVRLHCPPESPDCVAQAAIPPGDGCDASLAWWFSDEARNPKPSGTAQKRRELTLADLPRACEVVLRQ